MLARLRISLSAFPGWIHHLPLVMVCLCSLSCGTDPMGVPLEAPGAAPSPAPAALHDSVSPALLTANAGIENYFQQIARRLGGAGMEVARDRSGPLANVRTPTSLLGNDRVIYHVAASPVLNIYAAGAPHVYLYNGFIQRCSGEDELAAGMAHELAHLLLGHAAGRSQALSQNEKLAAGVLRLSELRYPLELEQRADEVALAIHMRAGWDPGRYVSMLEMGGEPSAPRIAAVRARLERLPPVSWEWSRPPIADERWFGQFKREVQAGAGAARDREALRFLAALPSPFVVDAPEQLAARAELQRELAPPPEPPVVGTPAVIGPTEAPAPFEKGPRSR